MPGTTHYTHDEKEIWNEKLENALKKHMPENSNSATLEEPEQHYIKGRFAVEKVDCEASHTKGPINAKEPLKRELAAFPSMSRNQALAALDELSADELVTWGVANSEYADSPNIFANFNRISAHLGIPPEQVLMVYAHKHMDGITSWVKGNKQHREPISGRIHDLRIYLAILYLMDVARRAEQLTDSPQGID